MNRRQLIAFFVAMGTIGSFALLAPAARAEDGSDSGSDDGGDSSSDDGGDSGSDDSGGGGDDDSGGDGGQDGGGGSGTGSSNGEDDHDEALHAVEAKDAMPLRQVLELFSSKYQGTVVDVSLIRATAALRYRVKFIDPTGHVRRVYFDAVSGALIL